MSLNEDLQFKSAMDELISMGLKPVETETVAKKSQDEELIDYMSKITGIDYSEEQKDLLRTKGNMAVIACAGSGKALVNGTGVLTINGFKPIEKLQVGEKILTFDGKEQKVVKVYPQGKKKVYRVHFLDETIKECCSEHLWTFKTSSDSEWIVENTQSIKERLLRGETVSLPNVTEDIINNTNVLGVTANQFKGIYLNELIASKNDTDFVKKLEIVINLNYTDNLALMLVNLIKSYENLNINNIYTLEMAELIKKVGAICSNYRVIRQQENGSYSLVKPENRPEIQNLYLKNIGLEEMDMYSNYRMITYIEESEREDEMTCIKVSDPSCLYVIEDYIVTHNTTSLTNLIIKRILSHEIKDYRRMICTTYSKGGADEMQERLNALLTRFGYDINESNKVRVYTLHAFFLNILNTFGSAKNICTEGQRKKFIADAAKTAKLELRDNDLEDLTNLISYQINTLSTDDQVLKSEANTLDNLTPEIFAKIKKIFADKKKELNLMDFDDMQLFVYYWLCQCKNGDEAKKRTYNQVRGYCRSLYDDFYIDEAQDVSKIQFEILKELISTDMKLDKNLVLVGDDDQCFPEGTKIRTINGEKNIEDIEAGDIVLSYNGKDLVYDKVVQLIKHKVHKEWVEVPRKPEDIERDRKKYGKKAYTTERKAKYTVDEKSTKFIKVTLESGKEIVCTRDHKLLASKHGLQERLPEGMHVEHLGLSCCGFHIIRAYLVKPGMYLPVCENKDEIMNESELIDDEQSTILLDRVIKVQYLEKANYREVYDINTKKNHVFFANNVLVHNCIYKWRGADPSIILNIGNTFDVSIKMLSTNYRCGNEIVDFAKRSINFNKNRYTKSIQAFNSGGNVEVVRCDKGDLNVLSEAAVKKVKELLDKGEKEEDICIMSRNNLHQAILSNLLFEQGIYCQSTDGMKLTKTYMYKDVKDLLDLAQKSVDVEITQRLLWKLVRYMSIKNTGFIKELQLSSCSDLRTTLSFMLWKFDNYKPTEEQLQEYSKWNWPLPLLQQMGTKFDMLSYDVKTGLKELNDVLGIENVTDRYVQLCTLYLNNTENLMYKRKDKARTIKGICNYVYKLLTVRGLEGTLEFLRQIEQYECSKFEAFSNKITLTTIHSAKGKEWKNVIAFAVDTISMPGYEDIIKLADAGAKADKIVEYIDEERRLYYVEITRGKNYVYVITTRGKESPFLLESLGDVKNDTDTVLVNYFLGDSYVKAETIKQLSAYGYATSGLN